MQNVLTQYMRERMEKTAGKSTQKDAGPVVTISRSYGCPAKLVSQDLVMELNKHLTSSSDKRHWRWISKEILEESAKELKMDKFTIKEAAHSISKGVMDNLITGLAAKYYPGDDKVKKTIAEVIHNFAIDGKVVIVGRAGVSITKDIKNSLHIRLDAPLDWRAKAVSDSQKITIQEATKKINEIDLKRHKLREYYEGSKKADDSVFDVIFNFHKMNEKEILESILKIMEIRKMI